MRREKLAKVGQIGKSTGGIVLVAACLMASTGCQIPVLDPNGNDARSAGSEAGASKPDLPELPPPPGDGDLPDLPPPEDDEDFNAPGDNCSPDYADWACVPPDEYDLDCQYFRDQGIEDFESYGADPYYLDGDGDGIACESLTY